MHETGDDGPLDLVDLQKEVDKWTAELKGARATKEELQPFHVDAAEEQAEKKVAKNVFNFSKKVGTMQAQQEAGAEYARYVQADQSAGRVPMEAASWVMVSYAPEDKTRQAGHQSPRRL